MGEKMETHPLLRKGLSIVIILLFIGTCIIPTIAQNTEKPLPTSRGWLYVGGSGPGNYTKIQDAVDNASDGDTVFVYDDSSPYYENVVINKTSIILIGEDKNTTVVDGGKKGNVVLINVDNVKIAGFMIQNSIGWDKAGIRINSDFNIITGNNICFNHDYGIYSYNGSSNVITGNTLFENGNTGIFLGYVSKVDIIDNIIFSNKHGIFLDCSNDINLIDNVIFSNNYSGVIIGSTYNCTITGNIISNHRDGICIYYDHNLIRRNTFWNNSLAVLINGCSDNRFEENNFIDNTKNVFDSWNRRVVYVGNYWDTWIGLKFHGPICQRFPKFVCISIIIPLPFAVPCLKFDWHPAQEPYDIG
jgi:parallel beta-helix repeat protein